MARPEYEPTEADRQKVERMAAIGIPQDEIARTIGSGGIDPKTLRKHFREELDTAATKANAMVGGTLYNKAINGDTAAAIWWSKTRMGWKETTRQENTGEGGGPIQVEWTIVDPKNQPADS